MPSSANSIHASGDATASSEAPDARHLDGFDPMTSDYLSRNNAYTGLEQKQQPYFRAQRAMNGESEDDLEARQPFMLHVTNIPASMDKSGIKNLFSQYGRIVEIKTRDYPAGRSAHDKFYANITFASQMDAQIALDKLNKTDPWKLSVRPAFTEEQMRQRRNENDARAEVDNEMAKKAAEFERTEGVGMVRGNELPAGRGKYLTDVAHRFSKPIPKHIQTGRNFGQDSYSSAAEDRTDGDSSRSRLRQPNSIDPSNLPAKQIGHPLLLNFEVPGNCRLCSREGRLRCSRCKAWYCSQRCQLEDWPEIHRKQCEAPPALEHADGTPYRKSNNGQPLRQPLAQKATQTIKSALEDDISEDIPDEKVDFPPDVTKAPPCTKTPLTEAKNGHLHHQDADQVIKTSVEEVVVKNIPNQKKDLPPEVAKVPRLSASPPAEAKNGQLPAPKATRAMESIIEESHAEKLPPVAAKEPNCVKIPLVESNGHGPNKVFVSDLPKMELKTGDVIYRQDFDLTTDLVIVQSVASLDAIEQLEKELATELESELIPEKNPQKGEVVACRSTEYDAFFRAEVFSVDPERKKVKVRYIDYGNRSIEPIANLARIPPKTITPQFPIFAHILKLVDVPSVSVTTPEVQVRLNHLKPQLDIRTRYVVNFVDETVEPKLVKLEQENGKSLNEALFQKLTETDESAGPGDMQGKVMGGGFEYDRCHLAEIASTTDTSQSVIVLHAEDPFNIFVTPISQVSLAGTLAEQVLAYTTVAVSQNYAPPVGRVCVAQASDEQWYRGVCLKELDEDTSLLFFPDFGFKENIKRSKMLPINDVLMNAPFFANHCVLDGFDENQVAFNQKAAEVLQKRLTGFDPVDIITVERKEGHFVIRVPSIEKTIENLRKTFEMEETKKKEEEIRRRKREELKAQLALLGEE